MNNSIDQDSWHIGTKIAFRFFFIYFALYFFPFPLNALPYFYQFQEVYIVLWNPIVVWVGKSVIKLHDEITVLPNGSGDTTWNYVHVLIIFVLSTVGTAVWTIIDRRKQHYNRLFYWLTVALRYYTGLVLIHYGFAKIIQTQFPLSVDWLTMTYAESSPMGLLWRFMGFSTAYNFFTGTFEALGGMLLLFRRTKVLGGLIGLTVLSNIVMLNFTYDVPVKLLSCHLLIMTTIILLPETSRMLNFFILNKPVLPFSLAPVFRDQKLQAALQIAKVIFIVVIIGVNVFSGLKIHSRISTNGESPFKGKYEVEQYIINGDTLQPLPNDTRRWRSVSVSWNAEQRKEIAGIEYMDKALIRWNVQSDTLHRALKIFSGDSTTGYSFVYDRHGDVYYLKGKLRDDSVRVLMRRVDGNIPLLSRGFHWVTETPFGR